jgi:predicted ATPase
MLKKLRLRNFKNFKDAELTLGPLTVLVGANGAGKSNVKDALRFLHGAARGYTLADVFGKKFADSGESVWDGIRGGAYQVTYSQGEQAETSSFEVELGIGDYPRHTPTINLRLGVAISSSGPWLATESLRLLPQDFVAYEANQSGGEIFGHPILVDPGDATQAAESLRNLTKGMHFLSDRAVFAQIMQATEDRNTASEAHSRVSEFFDVTFADLRLARFYNFDVDRLREPSFPGQARLSDRGDNFSSVMMSICSEPARLAEVLSWIRQLTPLDVASFEFPKDHIGRVSLTLVEKSGRRTNAFSASDGTLRFLAFVAALNEASPPKVVFIEEPETGMHPNRLWLLLKMLESRAFGGGPQVILTTHSPQLLAQLSKQSLEFASLVYRLEGRPDAQIKRILDIPHAREVIEKGDIARLHTSGWMESAVFFTQDDDNRGGDGERAGHPGGLPKGSVHPQADRNGDAGPSRKAKGKGRSAQGPAAPRRVGDARPRKAR